MSIPDVNVRARSDTDPAVKGLGQVEDALDRTGAAANRADVQMTRFDKGSARVTKNSRRFSRGVTNASYQVTDFATQVSNGTSASIALGQQLPQLLADFGILGAILSTVVAIGVPLANVFRQLSASGQDLSSVLGVLQPLAVQLSGIFGALAEYGKIAAEAIVNNLDRILITAGVAAAFFAGKWVVSMIAARLATLSFTSAVLALRSGLILLSKILVRTGIGIFIVAIGEAAYQFTRLTKAVGSFGAAMALIGDVFSEVFGRIQSSIPLIGDIAVGAALVVAGTFQSAFNKILGTFSAMGERIKLGFSLVGEIAGGVAMVVQGYFAKAFAAVANAFNDNVLVPMSKGLNYLIDAANDFGLSLNRIEMPDIGAGLAQAGDYLVNGGKIIIGSASTDFADTIGPNSAPLQMPKAYQTQIDQGDVFADAGRTTISDSVKKMAEELGAPLKSVQKIKDLLQSVKDEKISLSDLLLGGGEDEDGGKGKSLKDKLDEQEKRIKEHFDRIKNLTKGSLSDKMGAWGDYFSGLATLMGTGNKKLLGIAKAFQASQSLIDAWGAYTKVLNDPSFIGRPWARAAAAAQVLAAGIGAVNAIKSIGDGGSGQTSASAASGAAAQTGSVAAPQTSQSVALTLQGQTFGRDQVIELINQINEAQEDGAIIRVTS